MTKSSVLLPTGINGWQLYSNMKGAGVAAKDLTAASRAARKELLATLRTSEWKRLDPQWRQDDTQKVAKLVSQIFQQHLSPVMLRHRSFGATDTEPRYVGGQFLVDVAKEFYGISGYSNLGDYL